MRITSDASLWGREGLESQDSELTEFRTKLPVLVVAIILVLSTGSASLSAVSNSSSKTSVNCPSGYPCGSLKPDQLTDESFPSPYDSLDPGVGFFVDDVFFANVFQGLVDYNPYNVTAVVPALASKWTVGAGPLYGRSPNYYSQWNFTMRDNIWFSNGDPINAYVIWFSFVRELYMNSPTGVAYTNYFPITFNMSNPLDVTNHGNVFPDGLQRALASAGLCVVNPVDDSGCVHALNAMLSNFDWHNSTQLKVMAYPDQAYVAPSSSLFQLNTIQPYSSTLLILPAWGGLAVDPDFIDSRTACGGNPCGGVRNNTQPAYLSQNGMPGSGPYSYGNHTGNIQLTLNNNTDYWGRRVTGLAPNLQPAKIPTINLVYVTNTSLADFEANRAQIITPSPGNFSELWSSYHSEYPSVPFDSVFENLGYPDCDFATGINTQYSNYSSFGYAPVNYTNVRQALVHAMNYTAVLDQIYSVPNPSNGSVLHLGELYLPPIPPGFGYLDNPQNIPLYAYNIPLAQQLIAEAGVADGFYVTLPNGTNLGDSGGHLFSSLVYGVSLANNPPWPHFDTLVKIMNSGFNQLGISVHPELLNSTYPFSSPATTPPLTAAGWCADWPDPIYQVFYYLATPVAAEPNWVNDAALTRLLEEIPFNPYLAQQVQQTEQAYSIFTRLSTLLQMPDTEHYIWRQPYLQNVTYNPFFFSAYYDMIGYGYSSSTIPVSTTSTGTSNSAFSFVNSYTIALFAVVLVAAVFLGYLAVSRRSSTVQVTRRLAAIMFTDLVGYTALAQRNESLSLEVVEEQRKLIRPILERYKGREVKTMGDAFLVEFASALEAVRCAFDIQGSIRAFNAGVSQEKKIHLRIGIHLGDVVESRGDISGDAVNVASRIQPLAEDGGVCLTREVYSQVANKFEHPLQSLGMKELKNVVAPQEIFKIAMPWESGSQAEPE